MNQKMTNAHFYFGEEEEVYGPLPFSTEPVLSELFPIKPMRVSISNPKCGAHIRNSNFYFI